MQTVASTGERAAIAKPHLGCARCRQAASSAYSADRASFPTMVPLHCPQRASIGAGQAKSGIKIGGGCAGRARSWDVLLKVSALGAGGLRTIQWSLPTPLLNRYAND